jgi:hypothetical protein
MANAPEENWLRGRDLNPRPSGYEPDELPGCSTPRLNYLDVPRIIKFKKQLALILPPGPISTSKISGQIHAHEQPLDLLRPAFANKVDQAA